MGYIETIIAPVEITRGKRYVVRVGINRLAMGKFPDGKQAFLLATCRDQQVGRGEGYGAIDPHQPKTKAGGGGQNKGNVGDFPKVVIR